MARAGRLAAEQLASILKAEDGVAAACSQLVTEGALAPAQIRDLEIAPVHAAAELIEKSTSARYPIVNLYCDRIVNNMREKFRTFSGTASLRVDVRVTHEQLNELQNQLQVYTEAITNVLDTKRGSWADGVFYPGGYEIEFSPAKRGGRNYIQTAQVKLDVHVSVD